MKKTMSLERLLGLGSDASLGSREICFSLLFFSDIRKDVVDAEKYRFIRDLTVFADQEMFEAVYIPERHFHEFGAIFPNSAVMAAYLIPQTRRIRFRTAGVSLPLHHPAEVVEWWAMNDVLSGGRVDLGFGSGWSRPDFILSPDTFENRREIMAERIGIVQRLWRGESVSFKGPSGHDVEITVYPRPIQKELKVWMLVAQSDESFVYAGQQGYNVFTMLYGNDLEAMRNKIALYRAARRDAGFDPDSGVVSLMLHTLICESREHAQTVVERPFKEYIRSTMAPHLKASAAQHGAEVFGTVEQEQILEYAYERYFRTAAMFGSVQDGRRVVEHAIDVGVNDIACLMDFGVDYSVVKESLPYLKTLVSNYTRG